MPRVIALGLLRFYKAAISPWLPSACRFRPTCSEYMYDAVAEFGAARGIWLGLKRLGKCHPFHPGGYDPITQRTGRAGTAEAGRVARPIAAPPRVRCALTSIKSPQNG